MVQSPYMKNLVFFAGLDGVSYYSQDCGTTLIPFKHHKYLTQFYPSYTNASWVMAMVKRICPAYEVNTNCKEYDELHFSENLGTTWRKLGDSIVDFTWYNYLYFHVFSLKLKATKRR